MLHMIVATHGPETCGLSNQTSRELAEQQMARQDQLAAEREMAIKGSWVDAPAHTTFMLVDAPHAHAVSDFVREIKLMAWNTVAIHPVAETPALAEQLRRGH